MITYLPTILINIINQATNYFEGTKFGGDIIKVNLSTMMVLAALYISTSGSLPVTASVKYVEIWLLFSFIYPFLIVLIQTFIQKSKIQDPRKTKITTVLPEEISSVGSNRFSRVRVAEMVAHYWIPGFGVTFTVIYFSVGLTWVLVD